MHKKQQQQQQGEKGLERSLSMILPPAAIKKNCWHDETVEPRVFPGLVHEQTRTMGMCHGSDSENEPDLPAESLAESLKDEWKEPDKA